MGVDELKPFADAGFEWSCHRLIVCCVHQPVEVEGGQEAVLAIRDHVAVRIELCIDNGDILGMVTLFDEEERVVFSDIPDTGDRMASHRRTGKSLVHIDNVDQDKSCYKESHCNIRPCTDSQCQRGSGRNGATDATVPPHLMHTRMVGTGETNTHCCAVSATAPVLTTADRSPALFGHCGSPLRSTPCNARPFRRGPW